MNACFALDWCAQLWGPLLPATTEGSLRRRLFKCGALCNCLVCRHCHTASLPMASTHGAPSACAADADGDSSDLASQAVHSAAAAVVTAAASTPLPEPLRQLFAVNKLAIDASMLGEQHNVQHLALCLTSFRATLQAQIDQEVQLCVLFARMARALQSVFTASDINNISGAHALYAWTAANNMNLDVDWEKRMKRRQSECGRLWSTDEDCDWWDQSLAHKRLKIKSFNRLKEMAHQYDAMAKCFVQAGQRRQFWLEELQEEREANETKQRLHKLLSPHGANTYTSSA